MPPQDAAERILDAAAELIAERGYASTTTRAVAERAGVNEVTVFRRFGTKAGLLTALAGRIADTTAAFTLEAAPRPDDLRATLTALARVEIEGGLRHGGLALRLAVDARSVPEVAEALGHGTSGNLAGLTRYLAGRQAEGDLRDDVPAELLAESFFALTSSLVLGRLLRGAPVPEGPQRDRLVDRLVDLFVSGAARRAPAEES
jgi:AcrR family transcriptional regulator